MRLVRVALPGLLTMALIAGPQAAMAKDGDVIRRGECSGQSDWKLKLSEEDNGIEVEFEVDQNKVGDTWRVTLRHDGVKFFTGKRTTKAPSGSFEVRRVHDNEPGVDKFRARARNLSTDEVCVGRASF